MSFKEGLNIVQAVQVVYQLDEINREREYQGLREAMETYNIKKGLLITYTVEGNFNTADDGIEAIPIYEWLLK